MVFLNHSGLLELNHFSMRRLFLVYFPESDIWMVPLLSVDLEVLPLCHRVLILSVSVTLWLESVCATINIGRGDY